MPARDVHHWIDRWERTGLVDPEQARLLHTDATRAGVVPALEPADGVERVLQAARSGVVEALGYVGAALTLGAVTVLLDVPEWPVPALVLLLAFAAVVAAAGLVRLAPLPTDPARRLAGVLGAVAVAATAGALAVALGPPDEVDWAWQEVAVALPTLVMAILVYVRHRHLLTHVALGVAAVSSCVSIGDLLVPSSAATSVEETVVGVLLVVVAVGWMVASERDVLPPAWLGTPVAGAVTYVGAAMAMSWAPMVGEGEAAVLGALLVAAVATAAGIATSRLRVVVVGVAGLLVTVPMTFTAVFGWTPTATAGLLLPIGVAVTAWAVWSGRSRPTAP